MEEQGASRFVWALKEGSHASEYFLEQRADADGPVILRAPVLVGNPPRKALPSPKDPLLVISWSDQGMNGFDWFQVDKSVSHLEEWGHSESFPWLLDDPVFSPDGRYIVACAGKLGWWSADGDPEHPSAGGKLCCGKILMSRVGTANYAQQEVFTEVPVGWLPRNQYSYEADMLRPAEFHELLEFRVRDPLQQVHTFTLLP